MVLGIVFIVSLFLGSFYNVVALRTLLGEEFVLEKSHCTYCSHSLSFLDMIPLLSYIILRGRCRHCNNKISYVYPIGEFLTAISYTVVVNKYGFTIESFMNIIFITILILSSVSDLKSKIVPNRFIIIGILVVFSFRIIFKLNTVIYLISGLCSFLILYIIFFLSKGKMGGADVKIYGLIGITIGFMNSILSLFFASYIALFMFLISGFFGINIKNIKIPFIPFITLGVLLTYFINYISVLNYLT